jgi:DNA-binding GntR family transcriptional regulator
MSRRHADKIADVLEEQIFTGTCMNGERLDENALARRFDVSRTPVREALRRLVKSGLAEQIPRRGVFVRQPTAQDLIQMFELMAEIEAVCGRLVVRRGTQTALTALKDANAGCLQAIALGDASAYFHKNEIFHKMIYSYCGNAYLAGQADRLYEKLKPFRRVQLHVQGRMAQSVSEHNALLRAIEDGNERAAESTLRAHVGLQGERFYPQMSELRPAS